MFKTFIKIREPVFFLGVRGTVDFPLLRAKKWLLILTHGFTVMVTHKDIILLSASEICKNFIMLQDLPLKKKEFFW